MFYRLSLTAILLSSLVKSDESGSRKGIPRPIVFNQNITVEGDTVYLADRQMFIPFNSTVYRLYDLPSNSTLDRFLAHASSRWNIDLPHVDRSIRARCARPDAGFNWTYLSWSTYDFNDTVVKKHEGLMAREFVPPEPPASRDAPHLLLILSMTTTLVVLIAVAVLIVILVRRFNSFHHQPKKFPSLNEVDGFPMRDSSMINHYVNATAVKNALELLEESGGSSEYLRMDGTRRP